MMQPDPPPAEKPGIMGLISKGLQNKDLMNRLALGFNTMRLNPDPNLAAGIRESMADRREMAAMAGGANRTVAMLRNMKGPDGKPIPSALQAADLIEADPKSATSILQAFYKGLNEGPVDNTKGIMDARKEFTSLPGVKTFSGVSFAYSRIAASANDPSPSGDLALIFNFMKMLDPGSVVREGEFATAQNSGGVDDRIRSLYNRVIDGTRLSDTQRADFVSRAKKLYTGAEQQYRSIANQYGIFAENAGLDPSQVIPDFSYSGGEIAIPEIKDGSGDIPPMPEGDTINGQPMTQTQWESLWSRASEDDKEYFRENGRLA